jgi:uncharacterized membrane protein
MRKWLPLVLIAGTVVFSLAVYGQLPERVVTHWNANGEPNGYSSRAFAAFLLPGMTLAMWGILRVIPYVDPRRANIEKFRDTYELMIVVIVLMLSVIHLAVIGNALGWPISIARVVPLAVGAFFVIFGNLLPRFRSNFFMGIRTPWTLSSEAVWTKTHRVGGYLMVLAGVLIMLATFLPARYFTWIVLGSTFGMAIGMIGYSYVAWRGEMGNS